MMSFLPRLFQARPTWLKWAGRGFWAVVDQALFAGTNFLVGVLLARWLTPAAYGAFSAAYSVFLLLGTLHSALWVEPMLVYGSGRFRGAFASYLKALLGFHWHFSSLAVLGFGLVGVLFLALGQGELGRSFLGLAVAAPPILYLWLVRRSAYVLLEPHLAAYGGGLYLMLYFGATTGLLRLGWLDEGSAFAAMGFIAWLSGWLIQKWVADKGRAEPVLVPTPTEVRALHWGYGRWALLAGALSWVPMNIYFVVLPAIQGLESTAALKALLNLVMPVLHFNRAIAGLFIPIFVRSLRNNRMKVSLVLGAVVLLGSSVVYGLFLVLFGSELAFWMYRGKFSFSVTNFLTLALLPVALAGISLAGGVLRALDMPKLVAIGWGVAASVVVVVGIPMMYGSGVQEALLAMIAAHFMGGLALSLMVKSRMMEVRSEGEAR